MTLPYWTKLDALPTTNLRIVVSIALFVLYIVGTMLLAAIARAPSEGVLYVLGGAILLSMGLDVAQFNIKRNTQLVTPPTVMATDAAAPSAAMVDAPRSRLPADLSAALNSGARTPVASTSTTQVLPANATAPTIVRDD